MPGRVECMPEKMERWIACRGGWIAGPLTPSSSAACTLRQRNSCPIAGLRRAHRQRSSCPIAGLRRALRQRSSCPIDGLRRVHRARTHSGLCVQPTRLQSSCLDFRRRTKSVKKTMSHQAARCCWPSVDQHTCDMRRDMRRGRPALQWATGAGKCRRRGWPERLLSCGRVQPRPSAAHQGTPRPWAGRPVS